MQDKEQTENNKKEIEEEIYKFELNFEKTNGHKPMPNDR